jgi:hypothetical protein
MKFVLGTEFGWEWWARLPPGFAPDEFVLICHNCRQLYSFHFAYLLALPSIALHHRLRANSAQLCTNFPPPQVTLSSLNDF